MKKIQTTLFSAILFLFVFVSPSFAIEYGGIGGRPAYPRADNTRSESIFIYENAPGSVVKDGIVVVNNTSSTKTILVYATDTTPSSGGGFACKQYSEEIVSEGTWFKLEKAEVTVDSGKNEIVPFTVTIPESVSVGEHNACIVVQEKKEGSSSAGINLNVRSAIRAVVVIPGDMVRELSVKNFSYEKTDNGKNLLNVVLANTGNVSVDADMNILVKNALTAQTFAEVKGVYTVTHNNEQEFNFDMDNSPWGGLYRGNLNVKYDGNSGEEVLESNILFAIVPSIYVAGLYIILLISCVTVIYLLISSSRKRKWAIKNAKEYTVKSEDTLSSIAQKRDMSWKMLAKLNNIKPPYSIKSGDKILVPPVVESKKKKVSEKKA